MRSVSVIIGTVVNVLNEHTQNLDTHMPALWSVVATPEDSPSEKLPEVQKSILEQAENAEEFDTQDEDLIKTRTARLDARLPHGARLLYMAIVCYGADDNKPEETGRLLGASGGQIRAWRRRLARFGYLKHLRRPALPFPGPRAISPSKRFRILARDGFRCIYCGATAAQVELVVDHKVSVADGGNCDDHNLAAACRQCNSGKGRMSIA